MFRLEENLSKSKERVLESLAPEAGERSLFKECFTTKRPPNSCVLCGNYRWDWSQQEVGAAREAAATGAQEG